ncbi:MAG: choice-of-anchor D domain-containing protein [Candidatus Acidiferrales bacterium]
MKMDAQNCNRQIQDYGTVPLRRYNVTRFLQFTTAATAMFIGVGALALPQRISAGATLPERFAPASASRNAGSAGAPGERSRDHSRRQLTANPASVSFGSVAAGSDGLQSITLTNSGTASITISSAGASGTGFAIAGLSTPMTLSAGQTVLFSASFTPTSAGKASGNISIDSDAPGSPMAIALSGTGTQPQWSILPTSVNFGNVNVGSNSLQNITVTNSGTVALTITSTTSSGQGFSISGLAVPQTIAAGASATFAAQFAPASAGSASGSISVSSNASGSPTTIALSGTGVQGKLTTNSASVSFGSVAVGSSGSQSVTLTNSGTASIAISSASASGTGFAIAGLATPMTLGAGQSATFSASFTPSTAGTASGSISIVSNAPGSPMAIALSGTGTRPQIAVAPSSAAFGSVVIGNSNSQTITVSNGGNASLTISQAAATGAGFSTSGLNVPLTIAAGNSAAFNVVFAPPSSGSAAGSLALLSNAPNSPLAIPLSGTGLAASTLLGASPTSLSFGSVNDGTTNSLIITLTNSGNANVTISGVNATGAGFIASGVTAGTTLTPNQTATLSVAFDPATPGAVTGALTVTSNATNSPATISLSGTGVAPTSVALSWTASSSSDIVGYNEYRGTALGTYSKINSSLVTGTTYSDTTVQSGQDITYYYVVTAVNSNGLESADSSPASVTVP